MFANFLQRWRLLPLYFETVVVSLVSSLWSFKKIDHLPSLPLVVLRPLKCLQRNSKGCYLLSSMTQKCQLMITLQLSTKCVITFFLFLCLFLSISFFTVNNICYNLPKMHLKDLSCYKQHIKLTHRLLKSLKRPLRQIKPHI